MFISKQKQQQSSMAAQQLKRIQVDNIRKFKCESSMCRIPKIIIDKLCL